MQPQTILFLLLKELEIMIVMMRIILTIQHHLRKVQMDYLVELNIPHVLLQTGIIATKLEYYRTWTYNDIKNWLASDVGQQSTTDFYYGSEGTTPNDSSWSDMNSIQGGPATVIYDADSSSPSVKLTVHGNMSFDNGNLSIS